MPRRTPSIQLVAPARTRRWYGRVWGSLGAPKISPERRSSESRYPAGMVRGGDSSERRYGLRAPLRKVTTPSGKGAGRGPSERRYGLRAPLRKVAAPSGKDAGRGSFEKSVAHLADLRIPSEVTPEATPGQACAFLPTLPAGQMTSPKSPNGDIRRCSLAFDSIDRRSRLMGSTSRLPAAATDGKEPCIGRRQRHQRAVQHRNFGKYAQPSQGGHLGRNVQVSWATLRKIGNCPARVVPLRAAIGKAARPAGELETVKSAIRR